MKAVVIDYFGGPEALVLKGLPEREPKAGHTIVKVKAVGSDHAESHMRKDEWPEYMPVDGFRVCRSGRGNRSRCNYRGPGSFQSPVPTPNTPACRYHILNIGPRSQKPTLIPG